MRARNRVIQVNQNRAQVQKLLRALVVLPEVLDPKPAMSFSILAPRGGRLLLEAVTAPVHRVVDARSTSFARRVPNTLTR